MSQPSLPQALPEATTPSVAPTAGARLLARSPGLPVGFVQDRQKHVPTRRAPPAEERVSRHEARKWFAVLEEQQWAPRERIVGTQELQVKVTAAHANRAPR
jgi:hypothetical protein